MTESNKCEKDVTSGGRLTLETGRGGLRLLQVTPGELPDGRVLPHVDAGADRALAVHEKSEGERQMG